MRIKFSECAEYPHEKALKVALFLHRYATKTRFVRNAKNKLNYAIKFAERAVATATSDEAKIEATRVLDMCRSARLDAQKSWRGIPAESARHLHHLRIEEHFSRVGGERQRVYTGGKFRTE